jgi:hypothetical protein
MKKQVLDFDCDYNLMLFAISCHQPDYKICSQINQVLGLQLEKEFPLSIKLENFVDDFLFSYFQFFDDDHQLNYQLISNKSYNFVQQIEKTNSLPVQQNLFLEAESTGKISYFIPELQSFDYLFVVRCVYNLKNATKIEKSIQEIIDVNKINYIEIKELDSKDNLIWE